MVRFFFLAFLASGIGNFIFSIKILRSLNDAGFQIGFYEMRWQVHKHLKTYKKVTLEQTGQIGLPFYGYWISLFSLVMFAGLAFMSLSR